MKICVSPSNQNANVYTYGNTNEMEECYRIGEYAKIALERNGHEVLLPPKGQDMDLTIKQSNEWGADLHLPVHTNGFDGTKTGGTLVMLYQNAEMNNRAGNAILKEVAAISPGDDYAIWYRPGLAELSKTNAVAVYLEVEFHDTKEGAKWIIENSENIGETICKGVCNYYDQEFIPPKSSNEPKKEGFWRLYEIEGALSTQRGAYSNKEGLLKHAEQLLDEGKIIRYEWVKK